MSAKDAWSNRDAVVRHLAQQLNRGRLVLFLGAGVSGFYGLPQWEDLVARLCELNAATPPKKGDDLVTKVGALKTRYYKDKADKFREDVKSVLFKGVDIDFYKLRKNDLLSAIGAMLMASKHGAAIDLITLNYDDLVELYLEFHGLVTLSVHTERHWRSDADVTIYHPHGLLSLDPKRGDSKGIVFGTREYDEIMRAESLWRSRLLSILRSHTALYLGISGSDRHLQALLDDVNRSHAIYDDRYAYHGVRFSKSSDDDVTIVLDGYGVSTWQVADYDELPTFLFDICQAARRERMERR